MRTDWMIGVTGLCLLLGGCAAKSGSAQNQPGGAAATAAGEMLVVNAWCALDPSQAVSANRTAPESHTRMWRGQRVGFCSTGCAAAWDTLKDEQRSAALGAAIRREQAEGRPTPP